MPTPAEPEPVECPCRDRKPSQRVVDILTGKGVSSTSRRDPTVTTRVQLPTIPEYNAADAGPPANDWMAIAIDFAVCELENDIENLQIESIMLAEVSTAESIEPRTLSEA